VKRGCDLLTLLPSALKYAKNQKIAAFGSSYKGLRPPDMQALRRSCREKRGCDLLTLLPSALKYAKNQKIASFGSSYIGFVFCTKRIKVCTQRIVRPIPAS